MYIIIFILGIIMGVFLNKCIYKMLRFSPQYLVVEILNGFIYLILYRYFKISLYFIFYVIVFDVLLIISFIDYHIQIIPNYFHILLLVLSFIYKLFQYLLYDKPLYFLNSIVGLAISSGLFLIIAILSKGSIGGGDIKLIGVLGFILGIKLSFLNIFLSFFIGAIVSIFLILFNIKSKKDLIPFAPFICISFIITVLWGENIITWYFCTLF